MDLGFPLLPVTRGFRLRLGRILGELKEAMEKFGTASP